MCKSHFLVFVKKRVWWNFSGFGALGSIFEHCKHYIRCCLFVYSFVYCCWVLSCWANKSFTLNSFQKSNQQRRRFTTIHSRTKISSRVEKKAFESSRQLTINTQHSNIQSMTTNFIFFFSFRTGVESQLCFHAYIFLCSFF